MSTEPHDRTHPASPIRLEQAQREGDVVFSNELGTALQNIGGLIAMMMLIGGIALWVKNWTQSYWSQNLTSSEDTIPAMQSWLVEFAIQLSPVLILLMVISIAAHWLQSGIVFQPGRAAPRLDRLGPARLREPGRLGKALMTLLALPKMVVAIGLAIALIWWQREDFLKLAMCSVDDQLKNGLGLVLGTSFKVSLLILLFGIFDYGWVRWTHSRRLQMTDREVRDEQRMQEGDPTIHQQRSQRAEQLLTNRRR